MATKPKSLGDFASAIRKHNIARKNLFYADFTLPPALLDKISMDELRIASLMIHQAYVSEITFNTIDNYYEAGQPIERNHGYEQRGVTVQFYMDGNYIVKKLFDHWRRAIVMSKNNYSWPDDYTSDSLKISMLNTAEEVVSTTTYKRIWPKEIIQLGYAHSDNSGQALGITFVYETIEFSTDVLDTNKIEVAAQREKLALQYTNPELVA